MKILFTNKKNKNNVYFIVSWNHKIKDKKLLKYVDKFKFKTWEDFSIENIDNILDNGKIEHNILVFIRNEKKFEEQLENIIAWIWDIIIKTNEKFSLSFKKLKINPKLQKYFIELLAHKLYKFEEFTKEKNKYSINIDTDIDTKITENKIESIYFARNLMNKPWNRLNPETYENIIKKTFEKNKNVKIKVIKWKELYEMWAEWIYSVWKWSIHEPRMIVLEYTKQKWSKYNALVWKWVTFDTWGNNIKPTNYIEDMYLDMWGSAVVLWTFKHLVESWYKKNLVCWVWIVENKVSHNSYLPGDILKMYNWKTVKVWNTDAEWRLVLADVLSYVEKQYDINYIFDFATLTWAAIIALWWDIGAIMWRNEKLLKNIQDMSWENKERFWKLPLYKWYKKLLKDNEADLNNIAKWWAAWTITAWLFLAEFVKNKNWIHFDIAWPWMTKKDKNYWTWGSWFWIRLAIDILQNI